MRKFIYLIGLIFLIISCTPSGKTTKGESFEKNGSFTLNVNLIDTVFTYAYLNKIEGKNLFPVDSSEIKNGHFVFQGKVLVPKRYAFTFTNSNFVFPFILENSEIRINIKPREIDSSTITGSSLNNLETSYKNGAKTIFRQLDNLYPAFQKARLENNVGKLKEIGLKVQQTEADYTNYTFNFINKHANSILSVILLNDQLLASPIDSAKIKSGYTHLTANVKQSSLGIELAKKLKLP